MNLYVYSMEKKPVFLRKHGHGRGRGVANQNSTTSPGKKFNQTGENKQISISCRSKSSTVDQQIYHKSKNTCGMYKIVFIISK